MFTKFTVCLFIPAEVLHYNQPNLFSVWSDPPNCTRAISRGVEWVPLGEAGAMGAHSSGAKQHGKPVHFPPFLAFGSLPNGVIPGMGR